MNLSKPQLIHFLNALAFGAVAPLLYFMIALPDSKWIGLLLVVDSAGRILGLPLHKQCSRKLGAKPVLIGSQLINVLGYALICLVGVHRLPPPTTDNAGIVIPPPGEHLAFAIIYCARFLGAIASAGLPAVRFVSPEAGESPGCRERFLSQIGFALGCLLTSAIGNYHFLPHSILQTGGFLVPGTIAVGISLISVGIGFPGAFGSEPAPRQQLPVPATHLQRLFAMGILLACEFAFGMILCTLPLTDREICSFSPTMTALYFAFVLIISVGVAKFTQRRSKLSIPLNLGIVFCAIGFAGFATALWLSWRFEATNGSAIAFWVMWAAAVPTAIGHGLLRAALPRVRDKLSGAMGLDLFFVAVSAIAAIFNASIWAAHERSSLALAAAIMIAALPLAVVISIFEARKNSEKKSQPELTRQSA